MNSILMKNDITFTIDFSKTLNLATENEKFLFKGYDDYLVRLENIKTEEVRYGIMVNFYEYGNFGKECYLLEIPVDSGLTGRKREQKQAETIKNYIDEMRKNWMNFYGKETKAEQDQTITEFDRIEKSKKSAYGRWNYMRNFKNISWAYNSASKWFFKITHRLRRSELKEKILFYRMPLKVGAKYKITLDWSIPYICFDDGWSVSHFKKENRIAHGNDKTFYPFHDFHGASNKKFTKFEIKENTKNLKCKPHLYTFLSFYSHVIDIIDRLSNQCYWELEHYYTYVQKLGVIQNILTSLGPLKNYSQEDFDKLINSDTINKWDGDIDDDKNYDLDLARGITDIRELINIYSEIIIKENKDGRNASKSQDIEFCSGILMDTFFKNKDVEKCYEDLWAHNYDVYGVDLYVERICELIIQTIFKEEFYRDILKKNLYEHDVLNDSKIGASDNGLDVELWANMFYRGTNILVHTWTLYYNVREIAEEISFKNSKNIDLKHRIIPKPSHHEGDIATWIMDEMGIGKNGMYDDFYPRWKLSDPQIRKLTNYLLEGNKIDKLKKAEALLAEGIKAILGNGTYQAVPFDKIEKINWLAKRIKYDLMKEQGIDLKKLNIDKPGGVAIASVNMLIAAVAFSNAYGDSGTTEMKLRAWTVALSVTSDIGNVIAKYYGIQATLSRKTLQEMAKNGMKIGARRAALGLGILEGVGGSVGGLLGAAWYGYDMVGDLHKGNKKDAVAHSAAAIGCLIAASALIFPPAAAVLAIVGFLVVATAEVIRIFRMLSTEVEDYCRKLYGNEFDINKISANEIRGLDRLRLWQEELDDEKVVLPFGLNYDKRGFSIWNIINEDTTDIGYLEKLTKRVDSFLTDWDLFDNVEPKLEAIKQLYSAENI